jgi:uncharacterized protein
MRFLSLLLAPLFFLETCSYTPSEVVILGPLDYRIQVEIADSAETRSIGLMNRDELAEYSGMLFIFEKEQPLSFWMKNTLIPLDIYYIDENWRIVDIQYMTPCSSDPCPSYPSAAPAKYALEINGGLSGSIGATIGDVVTYSVD